VTGSPDLPNTEDFQFRTSAGMRLGFRGTANALQGGSIPSPAAVLNDATKI